MRTTTFILCSLLLLLLPFQYQAQGKVDKELEKKLQLLLEETNAPGFSIAVVKGDEVIYAKGFGYSDLENKVKVDENTLFAIGSTTKAFTTGLLGILEEEKGFKFSDKPRKYLSELEFYNDELNTYLTVEDLVCHRSGLPRHDFSWYLFATDSKDSLLERVAFQEPTLGLREGWQYNNFGYLIQGMISEKLTGKSWEDNIKNYYFNKLDMKRSNVSIDELQQANNIAKGYDWIDFEHAELMEYFKIASMSPAGSINSSSAEMANWLKVWLNEGKYKGIEVLPASYVDKAQNPLFSLGSGVSDPNFADQHLSSYGYAWFNSSYKGHYRMEHGGNIDGFSANVCLFPSDDLGIVVLCNQNGSMLPNLVRNTVADALLGLKKDDWLKYFKERKAEIKTQIEAMKKADASIRQEGTSPSHSLVQFTGKYNHPGYGTFSLVLKNDSLFANFGVHTAYLEHFHYNIFSPMQIKHGKATKDELIGSKFNFLTSDIGDIDAVLISFEAGLDPIKFTRTPLVIDVTEEDLRKHLGTYTLGGANLVIGLGEDLTLTLDVPGQPQYTLLPSSANEFSLKGISGYKARFEERDGKASLVLIQPNGTFVATRKD